MYVCVHVFVWVSIALGPWEIAFVIRVTHNVILFHYPLARQYVNEVSLPI